MQVGLTAGATAAAGAAPGLLAPAWLAGALLVAPWLNPFSPGPAPWVAPLLWAWVCSAAVWAIAALAPSAPRLRLGPPTIALAWLAAGVLSALIGVLQYSGHAGAFAPWVNTTVLGEAFGNLRQRNQYATHMAIALAAALWLAGVLARAHWPAATLQRARWALWASTAAIGLASAASSSRTGLLQWLGLIALGWVWARRQSGAEQRAVHAALAAAAWGYVAGTWLLPWLLGLDPLSVGALARLRGGDPVCASRLTLWANVLQLIALKPWLGWGWGELDWAHFVTLYDGRRFCDILDNAHNLPLHLAVELGVPLALAFCAAVGWALWRARPWAETQPARQMAWMALAAIGLHSLLEYPLWYGPFQAATLLALWLLSTQPRAPQAGQTRPTHLAQNAPQSQTGWALAALFLIALCGWVGWQYRLASQPYEEPAQRLPAYREQTLAKLAHLSLFAEQVDFARLTLTPVEPANAAQQRELALRLLHFSPEARVAEVLIEANQLLGRQDDAAYWSRRYAAAFPAAWQAWCARSPARPRAHGG